MFTADRFFSVLNLKTGLNEWYFQVRGDNVGPYQSKKSARLVVTVQIPSQKQKNIVIKTIR